MMLQYEEMIHVIDCLIIYEYWLRLWKDAKYYLDLDLMVSSNVLMDSGRVIRESMRD